MLSNLMQQEDYLKKNETNNKQPASTELINKGCYVGIKHSLSQVSGVLHGAHSGANH